VFKVIYQVTNWDNERPKERLVEAFKDVVINCAEHSRLVQLFDREWYYKFDHSIDSWVRTWRIRLGFNIFECCADIWRYQTL
jgi:hypothetical protein